MKRLLVFAVLFATLVPLAACTAELEEGCAAGPCQAGDSPSSAAATGAGGAGGAGEGGAGGGMPDCSGVPETGQFPCEVWDVLVNRCHKCHTDTDPAIDTPFPLLTFEKTREPYGSAPIWQKMQNAIGTDFMPLSGPPLIGSERTAMKNWFAQCAPPAPEGMGCEMP